MPPEHPDGAGDAQIARARLPIIAIDGPGGAGKSTVARRVAERVGFVYLDTGAMYRAVTRAALDAGLAAEDGSLPPEAVTAVAETADIELRRDGRAQRVLLNGTDVTHAVRQPEIERLVAGVAAVPGVRRALVPQQRRMARRGGVVVDGRDIGTSVLPDAECKFFITADFDTRVERRYRELCRRVREVERARVASDLRARDHMDETRAEGALRRAPDAVLVDTTDLTVEEAVEQVLSLCPGVVLAAALAGRVPPGAGAEAGDSEAGGP